MFDYKKFGKPRTEEERRKRHTREHPGTPLPPRGSGGGTGRLGKPRSDKERASRHYARYGTTKLPKRGSGLRNIPGFGGQRGILDMSSEELIFGRRK